MNFRERNIDLQVGEIDRSNVSEINRFEGRRDFFYGDGVGRLERTPMLGEALGEQRLAKSGLRFMGITRCTQVVSLRAKFF